MWWRPDPSAPHQNRQSGSYYLPQICVFREYKYRTSAKNENIRLFDTPLATTAVVKVVKATLIFRFGRGAR